MSIYDKIHWWARSHRFPREFDAKGSPGDVNDRSILDIWRGDVINEYREAHQAGDFHDVPLCGRCRYFSIWW